MIRELGRCESKLCASLRSQNRFPVNKLRRVEILHLCTNLHWKMFFTQCVDNAGGGDSITKVTPKSSLPIPPGTVRPIPVITTRRRFMITSLKINCSSDAKDDAAEVKVDGSAVA